MLPSALLRERDNLHLAAFAILYVLVVYASQSACMLPSAPDSNCEIELETQARVTKMRRMTWRG
jgi:hypothetical protein